ncbi:transglutaminase domain-containing protein [Nocardioides dongxiaopingii]|uniref:transglutaminase domain-containing protein n=1 Tax=Nocardioides dongxiaopingii TaxID=2576036 RepID=UPI0010C76758|nr:transglutaminase domain-containing protein [Nocardioides dongxiaopingii]
MSGARPASTPTRTDGVLADAVLALLASGVVLLAWQPTYAGSGWWIAGLSASFLAVMVAVAVRDAGGGGEVVTLGLFAGYLVVAGPLARGSLAVEGWDTVTDGIRGSWEVWHQLLTTHPPVTAAGPTLLPPILTGLVSGGFAATLALGSRRPAVPLVPVALALGAVLLIGQHQAASVLGVGVGAGAVAVVWLQVRAARLEAEEIGRDPARRRRTVVALVVVALCGAASLRLVGGDPVEDRYVLRDGVRPFAVSGIVTPLDSLRDLVLSDRKLLQVDGLPAGHRLRFVALDRYDGQSWTADNDTDPVRDDDRFLHVSETVENPAAGEVREVTVRATRYWDRPWVPTVGAVQSLGFQGSDADLGSDLLYNPATQSALLPGGLDADVRYAFTAIDTDRLADRRVEGSAAYDEELRDRLQVLDEVVSYWSIGAYTPMDALFKVAEGIRKVGRYSHGVEPWEQRFESGHDLRRLTDEFLLTVPTVGDEEQYAAAMALLATRMRIPARVVVGAVVPRDGAVRGSDVTAWVEIRAEDGTWGTIPAEVFMSRKPPDRLTAGGPVDRDYQPPSDVEPQLPDARPEQPADREDGPDADRDRGAAWWLLLPSVLLLLVVAVPAAKWVRRRRRLRSRRVSARYAGAWDELVDHARDLGVDVPVSAARPGQAAVLEGTLPLALEADRRIYGAGDLDPGDADAFWELVRAELREMDAVVPRWRRMLALLDPRTLR